MRRKIITLCFLLSLVIAQSQQQNSGNGIGNQYKGLGNKWNGDNNTFDGNYNQANGSQNNITGNQNNVTGDANLIIGSDNLVIGSNNVVMDINDPEAKQMAQDLQDQMQKTFDSMFNKKPSDNFQQKGSNKNVSQPNDGLIRSKDAKTFENEGKKNLDALLNGKSPSSNLRSNAQPLQNRNSDTSATDTNNLNKQSDPSNSILQFAAATYKNQGFSILQNMMNKK